ncbi:hypothetical protein GCM10027053_02480 [Intrasporangium mesophilum]
MTALIVVLEYFTGASVVDAAVVGTSLVVAASVDVVAVAAGVVAPAGAVGSAVTAGSPLHAARAMAGATTATAVRWRRRSRRVVRGRGGAVVEVFMSRTA